MMGLLAVLVRRNFSCFTVLNPEDETCLHNKVIYLTAIIREPESEERMGRVQEIMEKTALRLTKAHY